MLNFAGFICLVTSVAACDDEQGKLIQSPSLQQRMTIIHINEKQSEKVALTPREWGLSESDIKIQYLPDPQDKIASNE